MRELVMHILNILLTLLISYAIYSLDKKTRELKVQNIYLDGKVRYLLKEVHEQQRQIDDMYKFTTQIGTDIFNAKQDIEQLKNTHQK